MQPSSTLCRAQEARQNALAAGSDLANVRTVATLAAAAWAKEATYAEKREERMRKRVAGQAIDVNSPAAQDHRPDRGFAALR